MKIFLFSQVVCIIMMAMNQNALASDKIIIAHRGASGYLPEHTLEAKAMAHAFNADFIEQDVVLTRDGIPVVLHDHYLDTVTNVAHVFPNRKRADGRYYAIDFTLAEIKTLNAHERTDLMTGKPVFPNRYPAMDQTAFQVPSLEEELFLIAGLNRSTGKRIGIYPEIKAPAFHRKEGQDISKIVLKILERHGYTTKEDAIFLQCFDWNETKRIRSELGYRGKLIQLIAENSWNEAPGIDFDFLRSEQGINDIARIADGIGPWIAHIAHGKSDKITTTDLVKLAHSAGLKVHPYTLRADDLPAWASSFNHAMETILFDAKADGIFSDFPDKSRAFLDERL